MKIAFISKTNSLEILQLQKRALERGHELDFLSLGDIPLSSLDSSEHITSLASYDLVHYQASAGHVMTPILTEWLTKNNVRIVNDRYNTLPNFEDKRYQIFRCATEGVKTPKTFMSTANDFDTMAQLLGTPFILKAAVSSKGKHVFLINSKTEFANALKQCEKPLFQEYIPSREDYRVHRIGNTLPIVYRRCASGNDFRSNVSLGGTMEPVDSAEDREKLVSFARQASEAMRMEYGGIDIMKHPHSGELYFIESNRNPGWSQVNDILGIVTEDLMINFYEQKVRTQS